MGSAASVPRAEMSPRERDDRVKAIAAQSSLPKEEIEKIAKVFDEVDKDGSGHGTFEELYRAYDPHHGKGKDPDQSKNAAETASSTAFDDSKYASDRLLNFEQFVTHRALVKKAEGLGPSVTLKRVEVVHKAYSLMDKDTSDRTSSF